MTPSTLFNQRTIAPLSGRLRTFSAAAILAGVACLALPAQAAPAGPHQGQKVSAASATKDKVSTVAATEPETTGSVQSGATEDLNCNRSRKRLFVEGEGWIVRRVTTCY
jgi:hypothetical protein